MIVFNPEKDPYPKCFMDAVKKFCQIGTSQPRLRVNSPKQFRPLVADTIDAFMLEIVKDPWYTTTRQSLSVVFGFTPSGFPLKITSKDITAIMSTSVMRKFVDDLDNNSIDGDEDDDDNLDEEKRLGPHTPTFWITGITRRDKLLSAASIRKTPWALHTIFYVSSSVNMFVPSDLYNSALVCLSITYKKNDDESLPLVFKDFTNLSKCAPVIFGRTTENEVCWAAGDCHIPISVLEDVLHPMLKTQDLLLLNIWSGGNITSIGLVHFLSCSCDWNYFSKCH